MLGRLPENQGTLAMLRQVEEASEPTLAEGSTAGPVERDQARHRARIRALRALAGLTEEHKRRFSALRDWQRVVILWERCDAT